MNIKQLLVDKKIRNLLIGLFVIGVIEVVSFSTLQIPFWIKLPVFLVIIYLWGREVIYWGLKSAIKLKFSNINLLMTIAIIGAAILQKFEEAAVIVVLFGLGEAMEEYGMNRSKQALERLIGNFPKTAGLKNKKIKVAIDSVKIGDIIIIRPGDNIGLDGEIVSGESLIDESMITGEPLPKSKVMGDKVYAGSINTGGYLEVRVLKASKDSTLSKIVQLTQVSLMKKAESQKFIEKFAQYYTPAVVVMAIAIFAIPVLFFDGAVQFWSVQALTILLISCPCALVISTPISVFSAIGNANARGAIVKGGKVIEDLARVTEIGFDKTRTLTLGKPEVTDVVPFNGFSNEEILSCSAGLGAFSEHPLSQGIVEEAQEQKIGSHQFKNFVSVQGQGVSGDCLVCTDVKHCLGKIGFFADELKHDEASSHMVSEKDRLEKEGKSVVFLGDDKRIKGLIALSDQIKADSKQTIGELQNQNINCFIITGDNDGAARYVGGAMNISEIYADRLPEGKAEIIVEKTRHGKLVAMVGDGVNDAPALAGASVGIAMAALGSDLAIESADIALMNDDLKLIPFLVGLSRKTVGKIKFNTYFALGTKSVFMLLAVVGLSNLSLAIFADVGVTLIVVANGLSLHGYGYSHD